MHWAQAAGKAAYLQRLRAGAARRAVGHGHAGRLPERLAVPEPVTVISPVLFLTILDQLHARELRVRCAVLGAVGDQPDLQSWKMLNTAKIALHSLPATATNCFGWDNESRSVTYRHKESPLKTEEENLAGADVIAVSRSQPQPELNKACWKCCCI